jgi:hypothetical protein
MATKELAMSRVQWLHYFRGHPEVMHELVDAQLQLEEAQSHDDRFEPLKQAAQAVQPHLKEIEDFQVAFARRQGTTTTEQEMMEDLYNTFRGRATATARSTGVKSVSEFSKSERERLGTRPDTSKMTPEEAKLAVQKWEQEQRDAEAEANRTEADDSAHQAANAMAEDMNRKFSLQKLAAVINLANQVLRFLTTPPVPQA